MHILESTFERTGHDSFDITEICETLLVKSKSTIYKCKSPTQDTAAGSAFFFGPRGTIVPDGAEIETIENGPDVFKFKVPIKVVCL